MRWNDLKVGSKLGIGFGLLIAISVILGGLAIFNMGNVTDESTTLANEYVPEVRISNSIERTSREVMYNMRGYGLTQENEYLTQARNAMGKLDNHLNEARRLAREAEKLTELGGNIGNVQTSLDRYKDLVDQTVDANRTLNKDHELMDKAAENYMEACYAYLESQNEQYETEVAQGAGENALDERHKKITLINNIIDEGNSLRVANFKAQARRNPDALNQAMSEYNIASYLETLRGITTLNKNRRELDKIKQASDHYIEATRDFLSTWNTREELNQQRNQTADNVLAAAHTVAEAGVNNTSRIANEAATLLSRSSTIMVIGLVFALILGIVLALVITRAITGPLNKGVKFAQEIAQGNLKATVEVQQNDEIGKLAEALRGMADKLRGIVSEIISSANNISSASQQVSSSSQQMSQGSNEQASAAEEVSSSMEEMTSNIKQNTDNAQETEKIASKATESIKEGNQAAQTSVQSMQEIAEKISIINDIAYQTNILALNAAVEAARAGEQGKGFAVVAAEVRKLAERSGEAAKEIDQKSRSGVEISQKAGQQLNEIVPEIEKTSNLVREIAASSNEMNSGASQINSSVQQLSQVTQQNASSSEELASNSEELSSQADQLKELVSFFKVDEQTINQARTNTSKKDYQVNTKHINKQSGNQQSGQQHANQNNQGAADNQGAEINLGNSGTRADESYEPY